ncbi:type IX secretion system sortase PorU [Cyclobacterium sp. SYSU L10401]|uniref:type IX secretion system sortase PorU n=1 Tax=Cyclobacterium sp. SYSU L10401 TaxID=2678657 RepID=UPI0013D144C7|nr:type IX secretion system sortase PorU [Cyclobacterium sp. SYSU L10401]
MRWKHDLSQITFLTSVLFLLNALSLFSQQYYKFPVTKEGVYQISQEQALAWGLGELEQISIYGVPGMLPQKLDSHSFELKEIPQKRIGNSIYFFLSQADQILIEEGLTKFQPHLYTDSLYFLIQTGYSPENFVKNSSPETFPDPESAAHQPLYRYEHFKIEEDNILTSGRAWYGYRTFNNSSETITFTKPIPSPDGQISIEARVMAQSFGESQFRFALNGATLGEIDVPSIPNSRYAIKGREATFETRASYPENGDQLNLRFTYSSTNPNGAGFLNHILLGFPYLGPDWQKGVYYNTTANVFPIHAASFRFWDISNFHEVKELNPDPTLQTQARKLVVFEPENTPEIHEPIPVIDRSQLFSGYPELIIISPAELQGQANRLAEFKNAIGLSTAVVALQDIYHTYGYGNPDISSIRNFLAHQWQEGGNLQNVLFFGKGSFDYKNKLGGRPNLVPTYSSRNSLNPLTTYGSDDYFGFLEPGEGEWEETDSGDHLLDIGIGRIPAINAREAAIAVNKIIQYQTGNPGQWKRKLLFIADDGDNHIHLSDAENLTTFLNKDYPEFELRKLYLDNFAQVREGDIQTSPEARAALAQEIEEGLLMVNYTGHGNELSWAAENLFNVSDIADWPETDRYPIFVTATCEFGRHDSPFLRSGAEELLFAANKGAIAVLSTGRPVFSSVNFALNEAFIEAVFSERGQMSLGEIFKHTKNNSLNGPLNRNFSLLGDPSIQADLPDLKAKTSSWLDMTSELEVDTLSGLQQLKYRGEIQDPLSGARINQFDGHYEIRVESYPKTSETLGDEGPSTTFRKFNQILFRGQGQVKNGSLEGDLMLGKMDTDAVATGNVKVYALEKEGQKEAFGGMEILLGPNGESIKPESEGPEIDIVFYDSLENPPVIATKQSPVWVYLSDLSGIQVNQPEGILLQLNEAAPVSLAEQYSALSGSFRQGYIKTLISGLQEGQNTLTITARDLLGNERTFSKGIEVRGSQKMQLEEVLLYPNPTSDRVNFEIMHNRPGENLILNLKVFSSFGGEIFSLQRRFPKAERSIMDIQWIFLQSKTKYPAKGTYLYEINLQSEEDGASERKGGKIIIQ